MLFFIGDKSKKPFAKNPRELGGARIQVIRYALSLFLMLLLLVVMLLASCFFFIGDKSKESFAKDPTELGGARSV